MFAASFGLTENPFKITPNLRYVYLGENFRDVRAEAKHALSNRNGVVLLTARAGVGKSILLRLLAQDLEAADAASRILAFSCSPGATVDQLLRQTLDTFEEERTSGDLSASGPGGSVAAPVREDDHLQRLVSECIAADRPCLLLIDEAQNLSDHELGRLFLLVDRVDDQGGRLRMALAGPLELEDRLDRALPTGFERHIILRRRLEPLPTHEVASFISERLEAAGCRRDDLFSADAIARIAQFADGVPRLVNTLCATALFLAEFETRESVSADLVDEAARHVELAPPQAGEGGRDDAKEGKAVILAPRRPPPAAPFPAGTERLSLPARLDRLDRSPAPDRVDAHAEWMPQPPSTSNWVNDGWADDRLSGERLSGEERTGDKRQARSWLGPLFGASAAAAVAVTLIVLVQEPDRPAPASEDPPALAATEDSPSTTDTPTASDTPTDTRSAAAPDAETPTEDSDTAGPPGTAETELAESSPQAEPIPPAPSFDADMLAEFGRQEGQEPAPASPADESPAEAAGHPAELAETPAGDEAPIDTDEEADEEVVQATPPTKPVPDPGRDAASASALPAEVTESNDAAESDGTGETTALAEAEVDAEPERPAADETPASAEQAEAESNMEATLPQADPEPVLEATPSQDRLDEGPAGEKAADEATDIAESTQSAPLETPAEAPSEPATEALPAERQAETAPVIAEAASDPDMTPAETATAEAPPAPELAAIPQPEQAQSETAQPEPEPEAARTPAGDAPEDAPKDPEEASEETVTPVPAQPPAAKTAAAQAAIDELLDRARRQIADLALTTPEGDNAYETYQEVLALAPDHEAALQGLQDVAGKYVELAQIAEGRGETDRARRYYDKAAMVAPDYPALAALREQQTAALAEPATELGATAEPQPAAEPPVAAEEPPSIPTTPDDAPQDTLGRLLAQVFGQPSGETAAPSPAAETLSAPADQAPVDPSPADRDDGTAVTAAAPAAFPMPLSALEGIEHLRAAIAAGADVNTTFNDRRTPLVVAAAQRQPEMVELLLANGADPNTATRALGTPLMYAVWNGDLANVEALLQGGADVNVQNVDGKTALMAAAANGHAVIVDTLLRHGAAVNARTLSGWTPLMYAVWGRHAAVVEQLLEWGADVTAVNEDGDSAARIAADRGHFEIANMLRSQQARNE